MCHHLRTLLCAAAAALALSHAADAATALVPVEQQLLGEPRWMLQSGDGPETNVFFEHASGHLVLLRCAGQLQACRRSDVRPTHDGVDLDVDGTHLVFRRLPGVPVMFAGRDGSLLFPAWVVPTAGSRTGH